MLLLMVQTGGFLTLFWTSAEHVHTESPEIHEIVWHTGAGMNATCTGRRTMVLNTRIQENICRHFYIQISIFLKM